MNVYRLPEGKTLYHFDLYRLHTQDDFVQAGFDEYLYQPDSWCFIEWPDIIKELIKKDACHIELDYAENNTRLCSIKK